MPKVVIKEGICARKVIIPLQKPIKAAIAKVIIKDIGELNLFANITNKKPDNAYTLLTERSNSPAIIKKATPIAIIPNSDTIVSIPVILRRVKNFDEKIEKIVSNTRKAIITPNSGHLRI